MEFLPLWLAPWLLSSILLDLLGVTFVCSFQKLNTFQNEAQVQLGCPLLPLVPFFGVVRFPYKPL